MPRRKAEPVRDAGRPEERHLVADGEAEAELAADVAEDWRLAAFSSEEEDAWLQERLRRPAKRRRKQRQPDEPAERNATVAVLPAEELAWRFAAVPLTWQGAPCAAPTELTLTLAPGCSNIGLAFVGSTAPDAASSSSGAGATCQGSLAAPSAEAAEALLSLLRSGHLCCGLHSSPAPNSGSGSMGEPAQALHLGLGDKALADTAEYPEEQQQRSWHRSLLQLLLGWLAPHLDPEQELEHQAAAAAASPRGTASIAVAAATAAAASELLSSPLCSPRGAAQPGSPPFSSGGAGGAVAFDAAELYAAVKPTGKEQELPAGATSATLLPTLRRYQARAAQWMVSREKGLVAGPLAAAAKQADAAAGAAIITGSVRHDAKEEPMDAQPEADAAMPLHPLWREVPCSGGKYDAGISPDRGDGSGTGPGQRCFHINPYNGQISLERFAAEPEVRGGILSDEMGLGKTVELLACIAAHRFAGPPPSFEEEKKGRRRSRRERVECLCGATSEEGYEGLWLQCDECNAWMHAACVGLKRAPPADFVCGLCQRAAAAAAVRHDCGATLVVCPTPILHQWRDEILRHLRPGSLKLLIYEGQPQPGAARSSKVVTAAQLASADIVLTTYDVLRHDVHHAPDADGEAGAGRTLRRKKKYQIMPTPLTRLRWWRVCLDEAQMVESSTARAAQMALKLQTVHRWCVTGTPLSRGLEDLYGLLAFLQAGPYSNRHWWQRMMQRPYEEGSRAGRARLLALLKPSLGGLLWRSAKADVAHELGLPPQHHHLTRLQMSAIERHFYRRQHQECVDKARAALSPQTLAAATAAAAAADGVEILDPACEGTGNGMGSAAGPASAAGFEDRALTRKEEASLLHPLLRLRQACCHPQVGGAGIKAVVHQRAPMTMLEVLEVMLTKARVEAEDAQRLLLASLNGLAGLLLLQGLPTDAVKAYREALAIVERNKEHVRADALQQLHTMHNLADLLGPDGRGVAGVAPTLRDSQLAGQAQELRDSYLAESAARLAAAGGEVEEVQRHVAKAKAPLLQQATAPEAEALLGGWYLRAVALFLQHGREQHSPAAVANRIKEQLKEETIYLRSVSQNAVTIAKKFRDLSGLQLVLQQELQELGKAQQAAMDELTRLQSACQQPSAALVELAATCSRCRAETAVAGRVCKHCRLEELFWGWEGRAFALYSKAREGAAQVTADDAIRQAQQALLQGRVGRGGLGEAAGVAGEGEEEGGHHLLLGAGRRDEAVARTEIVRRPGDAENTLRLLLHQLRLLRVPPAVAAEKDLVVAAGKVHLELLEQYRRLYLKARALSLAQRARLYALDELEQCTMRIKLLSDNELRLKEGEEIYRIYEHEVPVRSTELTNDKAAAELELSSKLGTLRYLAGIKAREQARAAAASEAAAQAVAGEGAAGARGAAGAAAPTADEQVRGQPLKQRQQDVQQQQQQQENDAATASPGEPGLGLAASPEGGASGAPGGPDRAAAGQAPGTPSRPATHRTGGSATPAAAGAEGGGGEEDREDICPICHDRLEQELVMLSCAHRLCCRCSLALQERLPAGLPQPSRRLECPVCRTRTRVAELVYVDARLASPCGKAAQPGQSLGEEDIAVQGSYGTKLEAVVRRLLWLTRSDATSRVLVFSTWKDLLELLSHALAANSLPHLYPRSAKKFEAAVAEFRTGHAAAVAAAAQAGPSKAAQKGGTGRAKEHPQVLLLLIKQGGNGLNLTEAQHVVLCEPLLDPAVEAQAVGRVDRIGQQRATHVHRFVVERTIEENVHRLCQQRAAAMDLSAASVKRGSSKEQGALTVRDVALLLRQPEEEAEEVAAAMGEEDSGQAPAGPALSPRAAAAAAATARAAAAAAAPQR